ncbi:MAG: winged helix-turn-helix domain-containing protein [Actinomycetales bacterium]
MNLHSREVMVRVLGEVQCWVHGRSVPGLTRTVRRIVVMLAGWPGSSVNRDRIIEAVWGATIPSDAHNSLQGHVAALRRAIGRDRIATTQDGYALVVGTDCVDAGHAVQ